MEKLFPYQTNTPSTGTLRIFVQSTLGPIPVEGALVIVSYNEQPSNVIESLTTNSSGQTTPITLLAPPLEYSMIPNEPRPYSEYDVTVTVS